MLDMRNVGSIDLEKLKDWLMQVGIMESSANRLIRYMTTDLTKIVKI